MAKIELRSWLYIVVEGQKVIHSSLESMQSQEVLPEKKTSDQRVQTEDHREMTCENIEMFSSSVSN